MAGKRDTQTDELDSTAPLSEELDTLEQLADQVEAIADEAAAIEKDTQSLDTPTEPLPPFEMEELPFLSALEAVLFAAEKPVGLARIRSAFPEPGPSDAMLGDALQKIEQRYADSHHGFELRKAHGGFHFVTKMANAEFIRRFQASRPFRLGKSALEVLAIVAYRQPITRAEIDQVRGIDSSHLLRTLIERGLVRMAGKAEIPGRPIQYGTTERFLEVIGLNDAGELPPLSELQQLHGDTEDPQKKMEEGLERFMEPLPTSEAYHTEQDADGEPVDPMLEDIETMIHSADQAPKEVFASAVHREVAQANQEALEAFQASSRRRPRKSTSTDEPKSVTFDDLTGDVSGNGNTPPLVN